MIKLIDIDLIEMSPLRHRKGAPKPSTRELQSMLQHGQLEPIIAREIPNTNRFEILSGECIWRAAQFANITTLKCEVSNVTDQQAEIIVNSDSSTTHDNCIDEARSLKWIMDESGFAEQPGGSKKKNYSYYGRVFGYEKTQISHLMRLLEMNDSVQEMIAKGYIRYGQARVLAQLNKEPEQQLRIAKKVIREKMSVRQLTALLKGHPISKRVKPLKKMSNGSEVETILSQSDDPDIRNIGARLDLIFANTVSTVDTNAHSGQGYIKIAFHSKGELHGIIDKMIGCGPEVDDW